MSTYAIRTYVADPGLQAYIQRHPFLTGPDEGLNRRALEAIRAGTRVSACATTGEVLVRPGSAFMPSPSERVCARRILLAAGLGEAACAAAFDDFAWRVWPVPSSAARILCIGCGEGHELAFLRARAPGARIVAIDYVSKLLPGLLDAAAVSFTCCDLVDWLADGRADFDVVFSNHTLEHLFDPERVLRLIRARLRPGGRLVSGLPLDGQPGVPLLDQVLAIAQRPGAMHLVDMGVFDPGHPWKTNPADLRRTLLEAGFLQVDIHQRADQPWRCAGRPAAAATPAGPCRRYRWLLAPLRAALRHLAPAGVAPLALRRGLQALERRLAFGANRLKNAYAPDVVFSAAVADEDGCALDGCGPPCRAWPGAA